MYGPELSHRQFHSITGGSPSAKTVRRIFGCSWSKVVQAVVNDEIDENKKLSINLVAEPEDDDPIIKEGKEKTFESEFGKDKGHIITRGEIKTLEDALAYAEVDLNIWEVKSWRCNRWESFYRNKERTKHTKVPLYQVRVDLVKKIDDPVSTAINAIWDQSDSHQIYYPKKKLETIADPHMMELGLYDSHFGKMAWKEETGENYSLKSAEYIYVEAGKDLVNKARQFPIELYTLVIGNDFFHIDGSLPQTARHGHILDVDSRLPKIFQTGFKAVIRLIEYLRHSAAVNVIHIPGNHDFTTSLGLVWTLNAWFRHDDRVKVDLDYKSRKYLQYGRNIVGWSHGVDEKWKELPILMAAECKSIWSGADFFEMHVGHGHRKRGYEPYPIESYNGVSVRMLPCLCASDKYHYDHGYTKHPRAAEGFIWKKSGGNVSRVTCNLYELGEIPE